MQLTIRYMLTHFILTASSLATLLRSEQNYQLAVVTDYFDGWVTN